jgi:hypothetical protein
MIKRRRIKKWELPYFLYFVGGSLHGQRIECKTPIGQYFVDGDPRDKNGKYEYTGFSDGTIVATLLTYPKHKKAYEPAGTR